jgi:hypothetical protein
VDTDREVNAIRIGATEYLLTVIAGDAVHLTRETGSAETGQSAVPEQYLTPGHGHAGEMLRGYNQAALAAARWNRPRCAAGNGSPWPASACGTTTWARTTLPRRRAAAAWPSWTSCSPPRRWTSGSTWPSRAITGTVAEHGYAEMRDVPGDLQAALRKQVRAAVKKRTGHPVQTLACGSLPVFVCDPIHLQHGAERARASAQAVGGVLTGQPPALPTPWRLSWDAYEAG